MAQLFSSGVTPEYLKAMADAYAMYFPQQQTYNPQTQQTTTGTLTPEYQQALQQWYSQNGYSPVNAAPTAVVPQSVVGSLFEDLYPQTRGSGGGNRGEMQEAGFRSESPMAGAGPSTLLGNLSLGLSNYSGLLGGFLPGASIAGLVGQLSNPYATVAEARANQERLASLIAADPSYGGGGYGTSVANGGYGVTSPTGAGIAANPMGVDPATAQGQQGGGGGGFGGDSPGYGNTGDRDSMGRDTGRTGTSF
jgi:hypothetical protein